MFVTKGKFLGKIPSIYFLKLFYENSYFSCLFLQLKVGGAATNFSWEQNLFKITKPTSKSFSLSLCTLELNFWKIKMPKPIYSSEQTEGLSYSYFMILLPEGTFYHNCAVIVAFIKEEKRREMILLWQCFVSGDRSHPGWELGVRQGHENLGAAVVLGSLSSTEVMLPT